ncbi:hypothetical protein AGMMS50262_07360 [Bacteroidia bacterium]|nr:hypothetical protein AGMMS50262_07360 [Bacteroidia bacterium]
MQELTLFQYIQVAGGNKYREGYQYKITNMGESNTLNSSIEKALQKTLETIKAEHEIFTASETQTPELNADETGSGTVGQNPQTNTQHAETQSEKSKTRPRIIRPTKPNLNLRRIYFLHHNFHKRFIRI